MRRRAYLAALSGLGIAGLAGCTTVGDVGRSLLGETAYDVGMSRTEFDPVSHEATVGETVVWRNTSEATHTVTAYEAGLPDGATYFASGGYGSEEAARDAYWASFGGGFGTGESVEFAFEVPGTYPYFCIPHERDGRGGGGMTGSVTVTEGR